MSASVIGKGDGVVDLTGSERLLRTLREAEAKYRSLLEQVPAIVYIAEAESGEWLYVSPQIESILGYAPEEWMEHPAPFESHVHPDDADFVLELEVHCLKAGTPYEIEYRMFTRDGHTIWIRDEAELVRDAGEHPFWQGTMFDITELRTLTLQREELGALLTHDILYCIAALRTLSVSLVDQWDKLAAADRLGILLLIDSESQRSREVADRALALVDGDNVPRRTSIPLPRVERLEQESGMALDVSTERWRDAGRNGDGNRDQRG